MNEASLMKGKVIADFKEELKLKGFDKKTLYEPVFLKILNRVGDFGAKSILSNISRYKTLTFHLRFERQHVYLEWNPEKEKVNTLLNITNLDDFEKGGTYYLTLEGALDRIEEYASRKFN